MLQALYRVLQDEREDGDLRFSGIMHDIRTKLGVDTRVGFKLAKFVSSSGVLGHSSRCW